MLNNPAQHSTRIPRLSGEMQIDSTQRSSRFPDRMLTLLIDGYGEGLVGGCTAVEFIRNVVLGVLLFEEMAFAVCFGGFQIHDVVHVRAGGCEAVDKFGRRGREAVARLEDLSPLFEGD